MALLVMVSLLAGGDSGPLAGHSLSKELPFKTASPDSNGSKRKSVIEGELSLKQRFRAKWWLE
jgi:hypothetical protein